MSNWAGRARDEIERLRAADLLRAPRTLDGRGPLVRLEDGRTVVAFASNDYLGLTTHPEVIAAAVGAAERWGAGSGAARLITGSRPVHRQLEDEIASWKGRERALLFPSGYAANLGTLAVFGRAGTTIASDELNHASIVDGCRLARAGVEVYGHSDATHARKIVADGGPNLCVTDLVFSMDGDTAPLAELDDACYDAGALLVTDEAHCVFDPAGAGRAERLHVGTLSKFLGAAGGFVAGDAAMIELLVNRARSFIFTTAGTPADAAAGLAALRIYRSDEGRVLRAALRARIDLLRPGHASPILPLAAGSERDSLALSGALLERGFLVPAIRPPSVPPGSARLRVTLSAAHSIEHVEALKAALQDMGVHA